MGIEFDKYLGVHSQALLLREKRTTQLATNIANIDTPNYKAKDIDFNRALADAVQHKRGPLDTTVANHVGFGRADLFATAKFRVPENASLDGNTVDKDIEATVFAKNALDYQTGLSFMNNKLRYMMLAIRGE